MAFQAAPKLFVFPTCFEIGSILIDGLFLFTFATLNGLHALFRAGLAKPVGLLEDIIFYPGGPRSTAASAWRETVRWANIIAIMVL